MNFFRIEDSRVPGFLVFKDLIRTTFTFLSIKDRRTGVTWQFSSWSVARPAYPYSSPRSIHPAPPPPRKRMPTYALLGATGSTGSAILNHLLTHPSPALTLNLYVRSTAKLYKLQPSLSPTLPKHPTINIFEGTLETPDVLARALKGADVIFSCVAENANIPGLTIATDAAEAIIRVCEGLRGQEKGEYKAPLVVVLSSSSMNPKLAATTPRPVKWIVNTALNWTYADLRRAEALYRSLHDSSRDKKEAELLTVIFAQPGGLVPAIEKDKPTGHVLSTEESSMMVSYADLGVGMVEMAERWEELGLGWKGVSVNATGAVRWDTWEKFKVLSIGVVANWAPGVWGWGRGRGWW